MAQRITVRSRSTGKYHKGWLGSHATLCNHSGQIRMSDMIAANETDVQNAPKTAFCKKCFRGI
jgi:hypothetical protein